jgi:hypothetical protein
VGEMMISWSLLDSKYNVLEVRVFEDNDPNYAQWILEKFGQNWIQTEYNEDIHQEYISLGFSYDIETGSFINQNN